MSNLLKIGIDLGGTKTEIIAMDDRGEALLRRRVATPSRDYAAILSTIADLVLGAEAELGARGSIGVGAPGAVSTATGSLKNSNTACLNGKPLQQDLEKLLGRKVRVANDANCFALSEAVDGAGAGAPVVFGVILGTGVGGGIVIDGRILEGANSIAGEWGHNPLAAGEPDAPPRACYCGRSGCVETWLSGPGFAADHASRHGGSLSSVQIVALAEAGNAAAADSMRRYENRLALALGAVINLLDPQVIVLGGGLSNVEQLYARLPELLPPYVFSDTLETRIVKNRHGDSGGVRGAAWLW